MKYVEMSRAARDPQDALDLLVEQIQCSRSHLYGVYAQWESREKLRCSHSAPVGRKTNWSGSDDCPATYPGWYALSFGVVIRRSPPQLGCWISDVISRNALVHTASGGSLSSSYFLALGAEWPEDAYFLAWGAQMYDEDWCGLRAWANHRWLKKHSLDLLRDPRTPKPRQEFEWKWVCPTLPKSSARSRVETA